MMQRPTFLADALVEPNFASGKPLKDYFSERGLKFGVQFEWDRSSQYTGPAGPGDGYRMITKWVQHNCNIWTDGNYQALNRVQPLQGVYDYTRTDAHYNKMTSLGLECVQGGQLIVETDVAWVLAISNPTPLRSVMETHVQTMITRFTGIKHWHVVNEIIQPEAWGSGLAYGMRGNHWRNVIGQDYVEYAFKAAEQVAGPDHKLVWNNSWTDRLANPDVRTNTLAFLDHLLDRGCRIDGYGYQAHLNQNAPGGGGGGQFMADFLNQVASRGLEIYVTEFDFGDNTYAWPPDEQAAIFTKDFLTPIFRDVDALKHFVCWATDDGISWLNTYFPRPDGKQVRGGNILARNYSANPLRAARLEALSARPLA